MSNRNSTAGTAADSSIKTREKRQAKLLPNPVLAAGLSNEKLNTIAELLRKAAMAINNVECELQGTDLKYKILVPDKKQSTLWTQLYDLEKMFSSACR